MADLPLTGGCMCGAVRFEISEPLVDAGYCHCTRCQRRSGTAAALSGTMAPGSLRVVEGEEHVRAWAPPEGFEKLFCDACGSQLFSRNPKDPAVMGVRFGTLDGDPGIRPRWRQHVATAASWEPIPDDGLPRYDGRRP
jgi:hypothetical protein